MENELKPCAHCGGEAIVHPDDYVECRKCGVQTSIMANRSNAIAAWNARAESPLVDLIKEMAFKIGERDMGLSLYYMDRLAALSPLKGRKEGEPDDSD